MLKSEQCSTMNKYFTIKVLAVIYVLMAIVDCQAMNDEFNEDRLDKCIGNYEDCSSDTCGDHKNIPRDNPLYFTLRICDKNKFELSVKAKWFNSHDVKDEVDITTLDNEYIKSIVTVEECAGIGVYVYLNVTDKMTTMITKLVGGRYSTPKIDGPIDINSMEDFTNYVIKYKHGSSYRICTEEDIVESVDTVVEDDGTDDDDDDSSESFLDHLLEGNNLYIIIAAVAGVILVFGALIIFFAVKRSQNKRGGEPQSTQMESQTSTANVGSSNHDTLATNATLVSDDPIYAGRKESINSLYGCGGLQQQQQQQQQQQRQLQNDAEIYEDCALKRHESVNSLYGSGRPYNTHDKSDAYATEDTYATEALNRHNSENSLYGTHTFNNNTEQENDYYSQI